MIWIGFLKPHSHPNGFYWVHQCSWTLTANSMQVSIMQFDDHNMKSKRFNHFWDNLRFGNTSDAGFKPTDFIRSIQN